LASAWSSPNSRCPDAAAGGRQVGDVVGHVVHRRLQLVLARTQRRLGGVHFGKGIVDIGHVVVALAWVERRVPVAEAECGRVGGVEEAGTAEGLADDVDGVVVALAPVWIVNDLVRAGVVEAVPAASLNTRCR
jgi:hypothetical protein